MHTPEQEYTVVLDYFEDTLEEPAACWIVAPSGKEAAPKAVDYMTEIGMPEMYVVMVFPGFISPIDED